MKQLEHRLEQVRRINSAQLPGPESTKWDQRREKAVARALSPGLPGYVVDADGGVLVDADGNSFIDFASGIAVTSVGASNPKVAQAIAEAAQHMTHTCFMVSPYPSYVEVCEKLNAITPGDHEKKTVLLNSGAEAIENAVKIARAYTGRNAVVVFDNAYHGRTNLTMAMTAKNKPYKTGFGPFAGDIFRAPTSYPLRDGLSGAEAAARTIRMIEGEIGAENLTCVVYEPIQGEGGFIEPAEGFLGALISWCREHDVVFVADEIQSGLCRTGQWFACDDEEVVPDLITTAKALAGGMPLSAVTGRAEMMDAAVVGGLGGTYGGNPVACAAALAALEQMEELDLAQRARDIEQATRKVLEPCVAEGIIAELRGRGAMMALELGKQKEGTLVPDSELTAKVAARLKAAGVLTLTCGMDGNVIRLLPPLVINEDLLNEGLELLAQVLKEEAS